MLFVVLAQNEFNLRDAWYVHGDNVLEAMNEVASQMKEAGICPETVTVLPAKDNRTVPYLFPKDPDTDVELVLDFLRGYIRPVEVDHDTLRDLSEGGGYKPERHKERFTAEPDASTDTQTKIYRFPAADRAD